MTDYSSSASTVKTALDAVYVKKSDIVDDLSTNDASKPLSAKQGKALNDLIGAAITYITGSGS